MIGDIYSITALQHYGTTTAQQQGVCVYVHSFYLLLLVEPITMVL